MPFDVGCKYEAPANTTVLAQKCKECALLARNEILAQECSVECDGLPTYRLRDSGSGSPSTSELDGKGIVQCVQRPAGNKITLNPDLYGTVGGASVEAQRSSYRMVHIYCKLAKTRKLSKF